MTPPLVHIVSSTQSNNFIIASAAKEIDPIIRVIEHSTVNDFVSNLQIDSEVPWQIVVSDVKIDCLPMTCKKSYLPIVYIPADGQQDATIFRGNRIDSAHSVFIANIKSQMNESIATAILYRKLFSSLENLQNLNERENSVLSLAAEGVPNKTIARRLNVSIKTIEQCRRQAYQKLGIKSAAEVGSIVTFNKFFTPFIGTNLAVGSFASAQNQVV